MIQKCMQILDGLLYKNHVDFFVPYILFNIDMFPVEQRCICAGPTMVQRFPSGSRCALFLDKQGHNVNWSCALYHNERERETNICASCTEISKISLFDISLETRTG